MVYGMDDMRILCVVPMLCCYYYSSTLLYVYTIQCDNSKRVVVVVGVLDGRTTIIEKEAARQTR